MRKIKYKVVRKMCPHKWHKPKSFKNLIQITEEITLQIYQKVKMKITDNWWRWAPRTHTPLLMGVLTGIPCLKTSKIKHMRTYNSAIPLIRNIFICVQRDIYKNFHIRAKTWKQPKCLSVQECVFVQWNTVKQCKWTSYSYIHEWLTNKCRAKNTKHKGIPTVLSLLH